MRVILTMAILLVLGLWVGLSCIAIATLRLLDRCLEVLE